MYLLPVILLLTVNQVVAYNYPKSSEEYRYGSWEYDSFDALEKFINDLPPELTARPTIGSYNYITDVHNNANSLGHRYAQQPIVLDYKPIRPFYAGSPRPYPQPIIRPQASTTFLGPDNSDRFGQTGQTTQSSMTGRPPFAGNPKPYPEPIRPQTEQNSLGDRFGESTTIGPWGQTTQSNIPGRPPFAGVPKPYPEPIIRPQTEQNLGDRFGESTQGTTTGSLGQMPQGSLPGRPPFAGPQKPYPEQIIFPQNPLGDRFGESQQTTIPPWGQTTHSNIPGRPPYAGAPKPYPEPIIRPQTDSTPLGDRLGESTQQTNQPWGQTTQSSIPGRPPFAGNPKPYPEPISQVDDRFQTQPPPQTTVSYENFLMSLQQVYNYVVQMQKTSTPGVQDVQVPVETTTEFDLNKFVNAIKPLLTTPPPRLVN